MANTTADKTPISLDNLARNNERMKEYIQGEIDKIPTGGSITIDDALSDTSENAVQNKVINAALSEKADSLHTHTKSEINDFPTSLPASDVKAWAKSDTKPTYTASEVGADASGSANTALTNAKSYTDTKIADLINGAPSTLDTLGEIAEAMENNQSVVEALDTAIGTKANESDLTSHTRNTSNPHGVTKSQVGLGNVPNVATNDQTPSYTEATSLTGLTSGEKLSVAFGKISKAITDLISHIGDSIKHITSTERTNWNAAKTHADSAHAPSNAQANVIESIKVNGTALTPTFKAVDITVPTNNNQLTNGAGYITSSGTAKTISDTLPISKGGTGATTAKVAEYNILSGMTEEAGDLGDDTKITCAYINPTTTKGVLHFRKASSLWNYIKSKLATVATSGSYNDLTNKPTIPIVGDGTITITQNGTTKGTFTTNQSGNTTIALTDNNTDTKVTNTLATTTKAYVTGTTSASTNTGTQVFDTGVYLDTTAGMLTATTFKGALSGNATTSNKLASTSYIKITINPSSWTTNSGGGYMHTCTLSTSMPYTNFVFDVALSTDQSAAKLQIEAWNCIIADGNITQTTSSGSTTAFTFYAFTTKPSVALTVAIQGVS